MNWNIQEVEVGIAIGAVGGIAIGYELRKLVVRFQDWKRDRTLAKKTNKYKREQKAERALSLEEAERDKAYFEKRKADLDLPNVIPIKRTKRDTPKTPVEIPINSDRNDIIAALTGSGYSKAEATKAVDACSPAERARGLEAWTSAAFINAHFARKS